MKIRKDGREIMQNEKRNSENLTTKELAVKKKVDMLIRIRKMLSTTMALLVICMLACTSVYANNGDMKQLTGNIDNLKTLAENVIMGIGLVVAVFGGGMFALAYAQDNIESQSKGIKTLVAGALMAGVGIIVKIVVPSASGGSGK